MMLRRVRVKETGDTSFLMEEHVEKTIFERENEKVLGRARDRRAAPARHHQGLAVLAAASEE